MLSTILIEVILLILTSKYSNFYVIIDFNFQEIEVLDFQF